MFAAFLLLLAASPHSTAQVRQPRAPLPELSVWKQEIAALPMDRKVIEAKREEFYALFKDRDAPTHVYDEYATILQGAFNALRVAEGRAGILNSSSLLFGGLNIDDGNDAKRLFLGEFSQVRLKRDSYRFDSFLLSYLLAYGQKCETRRPPQAVEIRVVRCTVTRETYNGFGTLIGSGCASWQRVGSGRFGDSALVAAHEKVSQSLASKMSSQLAYMLANPASMSTLGGEVNGAKTAMEKLVANNECSSPGIRRFADNLLRFAEERPALTLASPLGSSTTTPELGAAAASPSTIVDAADPKVSAATAFAAASVDQRRQMVAAWYKSSPVGYTDHIDGFVLATDLKRPVRTVTLKAGERIDHWRLKTHAWAGPFTYEGTDPAALGIDPAARVKQVWVAKQDIDVIEVTAATVPVSEENARLGWGGSGGGKHLILPQGVLGSALARLQ